MREKEIVAVVVTYNRLELLKRCLESLSKQTRKDFDILVVNNGSTDGTYDWLNAFGEQIKCIHQKNLGGAGGFYAGQKYAHENGYKWVWMMDDDGYAVHNQLEELLKVAEHNDIKYCNALVCNIDDPTQLAFSDTSSSVFRVSPIIENYLAAFNGTLIHYSIFEKVGYIKKEMFIWGDEVEYTNRIKSAGFVPTTVTSAIHLHPKMKGILVSVLPFVNYKIKLKPFDKSHIFYRNLGYNSKCYGTKNTIICDLLFYSIYFFRNFMFSELFKFYRYYIKGLKGDFS